MDTTENIGFHAPGQEPTDVHICTPLGEFFLQSRVLISCSKWFAASMSDIWWTQTPINSTYKYRYHLDIDEDGFSTLLPTNGEEDAGDFSHVSDLYLESVCQHYMILFSSLYRLRIDVKQQTVLSAVVSLADQYEALDSISDSIRADLFEWEGLDVNIKDYPGIFLDLGYKLKSARIFKEAFIHCVGIRYGLISDSDQWVDSLGDSKAIAPLIRSECTRLERLIAEAMRKFLALGHHGEHTYRVRMLVRSELGRCFDMYPNVGQEGKLFRTIIYSSFQPLSSELSELEKESSLSLLQHQAKGLVAKIKDVARPLVKSNLRLKDEMVDYLTCAEISDGDLPWVK